jgi:hypothetical protein
MVIGASERVMSEQDSGITAEIPCAAEVERGTFQLKPSLRERKSAGNRATRLSPAGLQITRTRNNV